MVGSATNNRWKLKIRARDRNGYFVETPECHQLLDIAGAKDFEPSRWSLFGPVDEKSGTGG